MKKVYFLVEPGYEPDDYQVVAVYEDEDLAGTAAYLSERPIVEMVISEELPRQITLFHKIYRAERCGDPTNGWACDRFDVPLHGGSCRCKPAETQEFEQAFWEFDRNASFPHCMVEKESGYVRVFGTDQERITAEFESLVAADPGIPEPPKPPLDPNRIAAQNRPREAQWRTKATIPIEPTIESDGQSAKVSFRKD